MTPSDQRAQFVERVRTWAGALVARERKRPGVARLDDARRAVAARARTHPGTFENLDRDRAKSVQPDVYENIRALFIVETQREIARLSAELDAARAAGLAGGDSEFHEIARCLEAARFLLKAAL